MFYKMGHVVNAEEWTKFDAAVKGFLHKVVLGRWQVSSDDVCDTGVWLPGDETVMSK